MARTRANLVRTPFVASCGEDACAIRQFAPGLPAQQLQPAVGTPRIQAPGLRHSGSLYRVLQEDVQSSYSVVGECEGVKDTDAGAERACSLSAAGRLQVKVQKSNLSCCASRRSHPTDAGPEFSYHSAAWPGEQVKGWTCAAEAFRGALLTRKKGSENLRAKSREWSLSDDPHPNAKPPMPHSDLGQETRISPPHGSVTGARPRLRPSAQHSFLHRLGTPSRQPVGATPLIRSCTVQNRCCQLHRQKSNVDANCMLKTPPLPPPPRHLSRCDTAQAGNPVHSDVTHLRLADALTSTWKYASRAPWINAAP
eukprot:177555-Chlamydomonas_euryale.AAC.8